MVGVELTQHYPARLSRSGRVSWALLACSLASVVACGGRDADEPRTWPETPRAEDPGSGPIVCPEVTDEGRLRFTDYAGHTLTYELRMLENWEYGAGTGWYSNNPQCQTCEEVEKACDGEASLAEDWSTNRVCDCEPSADGAAGAGGADGAAGAAGAADGDEVAPPCPTEADIERIDEELANCWTRCREIQTPSYFEKPIPAAQIPNGGRCGSQYALHLLAGPFDDVQFDFQESWGGVVGRPFSPPLDAGPYPEDGIEGWDGICFWGRRGPASRATIRLDVTERHTDQNYDAGDGEPMCDPNQTLDDPEVGCDKFGGYAPLSGDWEFFAVSFAQLRQGGWGRVAEYFDVWGIMSIGFSYNVGYWDFWVDDLALYRVRSE